MIQIYTDGSCLNNQLLENKGGLAFLVIKDQKIIYEYQESLKNTTNNRMELMACIRALEYVRTHPLSDVVIFTDSNYVLQGLTQWVPNWIKNHWKTANKQSPVKNQDLWQQLLALFDPHRIQIKKVKAHAENPHNNRVDELAKQAAERGIS